MSTRDADQPPPCGADDEADGPEPAAGTERPGLPDPATVVAEETVVSPKGRRYRILKTRQTDAYEDAPEDGDEHPRRGRR